MKAILRRNGIDLLGSDALVYIDGRLNLTNAIDYVKSVNSRRIKNFPHRVADSFYFVDDRLNAKSSIININ
jgi:hypothetical protein